MSLPDEKAEDVKNYYEENLGRDLSIKETKDHIKGDLKQIAHEIAEEGRELAGENDE